MTCQSNPWVKVPAHANSRKKLSIGHCWFNSRARAFNSSSLIFPVPAEIIILILSTFVTAKFIHLPRISHLKTIVILWWLKNLNLDEEGKITESREAMDESDNQSKIFYDLSTLVMNIMRSPPSSLGFVDQAAAIHHRRRTAASLEQITPAGFASLLLGISLSLMICGSVTFLIGLLLIPWVLGFVMFLYFVGMVSSISMIGKSILCHNSASSSCSKGFPSWKLL